MHLPTPLRSLLKDWLLSFLGWAAVGLAEGVPMVASGQISRSEVLVMSAHEWLPWAILTPLIWRLVKRIPIERGNWLRAIPVHLVACVVAVSFCHFWKEFTGPRLHPGLRFQGPAPLHGGPGPGGPGDRLPPPPPGMGPLPPPPPRPPGAPWGAPVQGRWLVLLHFASFELPKYLLILSASHSVLFYRRQREREAGLANTRLEILQMRLQPHFLFNTLNTIAGLVHEEPDKADAMLTALSELLRLTLRNSTAFVLPLFREMEFLEQYVAIMKTRFEERLTFESHIEPEVTKALVPALLLQPLVENAVQHGLELNSRDGIVAVHARHEGDLLYLAVTDNGVGSVPENWKSEGIGLGTTRARLLELYGKNAQLNLSNHDGFTVEIRIPFKLAE